MEITQNLHVARKWDLVPETIFLLYTTPPLEWDTRSWKLGFAFNLEYLSDFFINFNNQWQFLNPHDKQKKSKIHYAALRMGH